MIKINRLFKYFPVMLILAGVLFVAVMAMNNIHAKSATNKLEDTKNKYIATQTALEDKGYNFTFNFHKAEAKYGKKAENKIKTENKIDNKSFEEGMAGRISRAHQLAYVLQLDLGNLDITDYKMDAKVSTEVHTYCNELKRLYNEDIMAVDFPEDYKKVQQDLKDNGKNLVTELDNIGKNKDNMDSDKVMNSIRILSKFRKACEENTSIS